MSIVFGAGGAGDAGSPSAEEGASEECYRGALE